jgi:hypothetical protein
MGKFSFKTFLFYCLILAPMQPNSVTWASEVAVLQVRYRQAAELVPVVKSIFIRAGKEIPYSRGSTFFRRYAPGGETVTWHTVASGFEITPTIVGDTAHLKIVPRIAYDDRQDAVIRFFGARTELTTPLGSWVEFGGVADQQNEVVREILSRGSGSEKTSSSMSLMVERL